MRISISGLALLAALALIASDCLAKDAKSQPSPSSSLASKLLPQTHRTRTARSLGDMFEKVKSKIFGSKKQAAAAAASAGSSAQVQPASSVNVAQRQPWGDMGPYSSLSTGNYQWPANANTQYLGQPSFNYAPSANYPGMGSNGQPSSMMPAIIDNQAQVGQAALNPAANSNQAQANGGLLSSASHLISQYLSPNGANGNSASQVGAQQGVQSSQQQAGMNQPSQSLINSQQQYNEFASILDSMVAQTGAANNQRQPANGNQMNQYNPNGQQGMQPAAPQQQGAPQQVGAYQQPGNGMMSAGGMVSGAGDVDMSASSNVQSYMPSATPQQASQKSSMVSLAEQLAPGSQFSKLVSFPFSLSNNDDANKEGRYKLHIPFLNQHVKRSDQQQQVVANGQRQVQYLQAPQQQQQQSAGVQQVAPVQQQASPQVSVSSSSSSSSSSVVSSQQQSSAVPAQQSNQRPAWSVADMQSSVVASPSSSSSSAGSAGPSQVSSSSKLIPMQSQAASAQAAVAVDSNSQADH